MTPTAGSSTASRTSLPAFYFDLSSPESWLAAERVLRVVPSPCEWIPVAMPFEGGFRCAEEETIFRAEIEREAAARGLQEVRWPDEFPFDSSFAQRAATYAKGGGKAVGFALAAYRQAFAGGRDLSDPRERHDRRRRGGDPPARAARRRRHRGNPRAGSRRRRRRPASEAFGASLPSGPAERSSTAIRPWRPQAAAAAAAA